ncbi:hypothetical protein C8J56DRAFT_1060044 [Mycena floridula]|nr:hypothetical protein C8J56DRAFT_1060044 [Mycena floridula]
MTLGPDSTVKDRPVEVFGPILTVVPVDNVEEAISIIDARYSPLSSPFDFVDQSQVRLRLVIYVFTDSEGIKEKFLQSTQSGTLVLNDTVVQLGGTLDFF